MLVRRAIQRASFDQVAMSSYSVAEHEIIDDIAPGADKFKSGRHKGLGSARQAANLAEER